MKKCVDGGKEQEALRLDFMHSMLAGIGTTLVSICKTSRPSKLNGDRKL